MNAPRPLLAKVVTMMAATTLITGACGGSGDGDAEPLAVAPDTDDAGFVDTEPLTDEIDEALDDADEALDDLLAEDGSPTPESTPDPPAPTPEPTATNPPAPTPETTAASGDDTDTDTDTDTDDPGVDAAEDIDGRTADDTGGDPDDASPADAIDDRDDGVPEGAAETGAGGLAERHRTNRAIELRFDSANVALGEAAAPARLRIAAIDVDATVGALGLRVDGRIEVPSDFDDAGWWTGGPEPGERGPAVLLGHVDSVEGPAVFARLTELVVGDRIVIERIDGTRIAYIVGGSESVDKDAFPTDRVYGPTAGADLRLVTCDGTFDETTRSYEKNLIVYATAIAGSDTALGW